MLARILVLASCFPFIVTTVGCQNNEGFSEGTGQATDDLEQRLLGKWKIDPEATKKGWGDQVKEIERKMVDEMTMQIEFKKEGKLTITKNENSGDGFWETQSKDKNVITIRVFQSKDSERKTEIKITFDGNDRFKYQSSEVNGEDRLIFVRNDK